MLDDLYSIVVHNLFVLIKHCNLYEQWNVNIIMNEKQIYSS